MRQNFLSNLILTFDKLSKTPISSFIDKSKKIAQARLLCRSSLQTIDLISYQVCTGIFNINQLDFGTSRIKIRKDFKPLCYSKSNFSTLY